MGIASDFVLIVVAGLVGGLLARLLRLPLLVGYVAAGVVIGPYTAGPTVVQIHDIELLAEIGVALLLFSLGLEISFRDLQPVRRFALIGGPIQILVTAAMGALAGIKFLGLSATDSIWLGAMISLSSTMVVLKTLSATGMTSTLASRAMIGLLVAQDLAVIPMLIILPQLADLSGALPRLARAAGIAVVVLAAMVALGRWLLPMLLKRVLALGSRELFLVAVVAAGVGVGYAAQAAGLSFALGAFVAGIVLSQSEFSHQALSDVVPLRDIFGLLFFVTVGMLFDPRFVWEHAVEVALVTLFIIVSKALILGSLAVAFGYRNMAPWIIGLGLSQIGEFGFVLARSGVGAGLLSQTAYSLALTCTILTMALSPLVSSAAIPLGRLWQRWRKPVQPALDMDLPKEPLEGHVVVAGYGRSGRAVARALRAGATRFVVVELDHAMFTLAVADGMPAVWGDVTREEVLAAARIARARILVVTVPDRGSVQLTVQHARRVHPTVAVVARAVRESDVAELRALGVTAVVQPEFEGGVEMLRQTLIYCGRDGDAIRLVSELRDSLYGAA
ncbi:MAG: ybaL 3 [Bryobacterales bacterium]|nr:ybaL 3 [Bryobacterales bacterium]